MFIYKHIYYIYYKHIYSCSYTNRPVIDSYILFCASSERILDAQRSLSKQFLDQNMFVKSCINSLSTNLINHLDHQHWPKPFIKHDSQATFIHILCYQLSSTIFINAPLSNIDIKTLAHKHYFSKDSLGKKRHEDNVLTRFNSTRQ